MKTNDSTKKSLLIGFATALFLLAVFAPFYVKAPLTEGSAALPPLPLGTNRLIIGANVYQSNGYHFGAVVEIDE